MATHSSILAWKIPWTEEPSRLQSMGSHRVRHDWATNTHTHTHGYHYLGFAAVVWGFIEFSSAPGKSELSGTVCAIKITRTHLWLEVVLSPFVLTCYQTGGNFFLLSMNQKEWRPHRHKKGRALTLPATPPSLNDNVSLISCSVHTWILMPRIV